MTARLFMAACAAAGLLSAAACNSNGTNASDQTKTAADRTPATAPNATGTSGTADDNAKAQPITLNGCLQKGDGHSDYILTEMNEPPAGHATPADSGKVEREQVKEAEHSYRLNADNSKDDLAKLVGHQVKVSGTMAKRADIDTKVGTSGSNDRNGANIDEGDLAKVDVASVEQVSASCGGHASKRGAKNSSAKPRRK